MKVLRKQAITYERFHLLNIVGIKSVLKLAITYWNYFFVLLVGIKMSNLWLKYLLN